MQNYDKYKPHKPPISLNPPSKTDLLWTDKLKEYMAVKMEIESDEETERRKQVLLKVSDVVMRWIRRVGMEVMNLSEEEAEDAGGGLHVSGSHKLGIREVGADIDAVCVAPNFCTREHFFKSLKEDFMNHPSVTEFSSIEGALVPIMSFDFEKVSIDLLFARLAENYVPKDVDLLEDSILNGCDRTTVLSLNGPRVTKMLETIIGDQYQNFLIVVRCVRRWAKAKGLYGNKLGYLGGVNFNILVAHICQLYPKASAFFLLTRFFSHFGIHWRWPEPVQLNDIQSDPPDAYEQREVWSPKPYHHFPIITPAYPATNSSDKVSKHTREVMVDEMAKAWDVTKAIFKGVSDWDSLFENSDFYLRYSHYLKCNIIGTGDDSDSRFWMGFCESRLVALPRYLENSCTKNIIHLYPVAHKTSGANSFCYFIGFDFDDKYKKEDKADVERIISQCCNDFESQVLYHPEKGFKGNKIDGCDFEISLIPWARLPSNLMDVYGGKIAAKAKRQAIKNAKAALEEAKKKDTTENAENNNSTDTTVQNQSTSNVLSSVEDIVKVKRKRAEDEANHPTTNSKSKQVTMVRYDIIAPKIASTSNKIKPGFAMINVKW